MVERQATFDPLDDVLSEQMGNEGCPNSGRVIKEGSLIKIEVVRESTVEAALEEPTETG